MDSPRTNSPDNLDLEALDQMQRGRGWTLFQERAIEMRQRALLNAALNAPTWEEVLQARAEYQAIDRVLAIPRILREEAKATARDAKIQWPPEGLHAQK